ncbi:MAG: hypothetical protein JWM90_1337 [Thermoleophilia bacterium]|nr:hypothetical protein [Thermoleophilia bacterium]
MAASKTTSTTVAGQALASSMQLGAGVSLGGGSAANQALAGMATQAAAGHSHGAATTAGGAGAGPAAAGHAHAAGGGHAGPQLALTTKDDPRFLKGTVGPASTKEGDAATVKGAASKKGKGFDGREGQDVNDNDRQQMNYSVTDANFNPRLGLLPANPDTGKEMNYTQHTNTYNMAGSLDYLPQMLRQTGDTQRAALIESMNAKIVANQNAGIGTKLGAAGAAYGVFKTQDPALQGVTAEELGALQSLKNIPGTNMDLKQYVISSKDVTGQNWARMHHPESAWQMLATLLPYQQSGRMTSEQMLVLAGDDGVSGSGRLNGVNNQDGKDSFNDGEIEIWAMAAQMGDDVVQAMMSGHNHNDQSADALTNPNINKIAGVKGREASPERAAAIAEVLRNGKVGDAGDAKKDGTKADDKVLIGKK